MHRVSTPPTNLGRGRKRAAEGTVGPRRAGDGARAAGADFVVRRLDGRGPAVVSGRHAGKSTAAPVRPAAGRNSACVARWWWHRQRHPNIASGASTPSRRAVRALSPKPRRCRRHRSRLAEARLRPSQNIDCATLAPCPERNQRDKQRLYRSRLSADHTFRSSDNYRASTV